MTKVKSFDYVDFKQFDAPLITVYENPSDFPNKFVARIFDFEKSTSFHIVRDTLKEIRADIPLHFVRLNRNALDEPQIVEVWT